MEGEPNGLGGSRLQTQLRAVNGNTRINEIAERRKLGPNQVLDLDPVPFFPDEQILIG